jgi:anti-sigma factor RsiW
MSPMMHDFDDETLMAYADGEADEATAGAIETAMETDTELAERVALFFDSRKILAGTMKPLIGAPVPEPLLASVREAIAAATAREAESAAAGRVVPLAAARARRVLAWQSNWAMPVAASILAAVAGLGGFVAGRFSAPDGNAAATQIAQALSTETSGRDVAMTKTGGTLHLVSSFRDAGGELCREYELRSPAGASVTIACHAAGTWVARLTVAKPALEGYSPASGAETVDAYLGTISAGPPLSTEEEATALAALK